MNNRKNYNSIVFLTTLSVYLGLVLVGGAPSVLAQAATTRNFDIKSEIVIEDDLDKKPDDETCPPLKPGADRRFIEPYAKMILALLDKNRLPEVDVYKIKKDIFTDGFSYSLDADKLLGKLNLKSRFENDISPVAHSGLSILHPRRLEAPDKPASNALNNTRISFENNQVFIVTRLPRGSIDNLLAE